jgi:hypothetical protein
VVAAAIRAGAMGAWQGEPERGGRGRAAASSGDGVVGRDRRGRRATGYLSERVGLRWPDERRPHDADALASLLPRVHSLPSRYSSFQ